MCVFFFFFLKKLKELLSLPGNCSLKAFMLLLHIQNLKQSPNLWDSHNHKHPASCTASEADGTRFQDPRAQPPAPKRFLLGLAHGRREGRACKGDTGLGSWVPSPEAV